MKRQATNNELAITVGIISSKVDRISEDIKEIKQTLVIDVATKEWVTSRYDTMRAIVYGIVGIFGTAIVGAIVSLILIKK